MLGGTQSLHTNALDEVYALPTAEAAELALRTQQVIANETGVADTIDPLGGSWYVEALTDRMEEAAEEIFETIDRKGAGSMLAGVLAGIDEGWFQGRLSDSAYEFEKKVTSGERGIVGINRHLKEDEDDIQILRISEEIETAQRLVLGDLRAGRDEAVVTSSLAALQQGASGTANLMELIVDAARARATEGEIVACLQEVFGDYREPAWL